MSNQDHFEALKAAADPGRVAAALGLRGRGKRFFCPSCQPEGGKTPDLVILDWGFQCHKCGQHGDLLKLVMDAGKMTFPDAVRWLERETGIYPKERQKGGYQDKGPVEKSRPGASWKAQPGNSVTRKAETAAKADPDVYAAFLAGCRPVEGPALDWLTKEKGIAPEVVAALGLRFCGREYLEIMNDLKARFGEDALLTAGLVKRSSKGDRLVPSFWHYYAKKAGFLVIPYYLDGHPVYLKARPPVSKQVAERRELVRFLNTAAAVPCLYNVDALKAKPGRVLICEGESDTWTALSYGFAAVGSPGAKHFKPAWVELFRDFQKDGRSTVYLILDADAAGAEGSRTIADLFLKADLLVPLKMTVPSGKDLNGFMKDGITA